MALMELSPIEREELSKNRIPIVLLFEPSADEFSYESKFVPLTDKYLDPAFFTPYIVGTSGLTRSLSGTGSIPLELRIAFTGHRGIIRFFLYVTALAMSSFLLVRATKISRSKVLATMAGHCSKFLARARPGSRRGTWGLPAGRTRG